jgi:hypothetical protein
MNDIFCIISAIGVDYGVYSYQERLKQLIETIKSVKKYKPDAYICLMEVSDVPVKQADAHVLQLLVNRACFLHDHKFIKEILVKLDDKDTNRGARKTIGELIGMLEFMGWLRHQPLQFNRVYKLAGRLRLNDNFLLTDYSKLQNKVVTTKRWWYDRYAYIIQLWSFDHKMLDDIFKIFLEIWDYEIDILTNKSQVDIVETTLYRYLVKYNILVEELQCKLGVEGNHGQDGAIVDV